MFELPAAEIAAEAETAATEIATRYDAAKYHQPFAPSTAQDEICFDVLEKEKGVNRSVLLNDAKTRTIYAK